MSVLTIEWMSRRVPEYWAGVGLLVLGIIFFIWATSAVVAGYDDCGRSDLPRWHHRRWLPNCFSFWLGWTLCGAAIIFSYLGFIILLNGRGTPLWALILSVGTGLAAIAAFRSWAREKGEPSR